MAASVMSAAIAAIAAIAACLLSPVQAGVVVADSLTSVEVEAPVFDERLSAGGGCDPAGCEASLTRVCTEHVVCGQYTHLPLQIVRQKKKKDLRGEPYAVVKSSTLPAVVFMYSCTLRHPLPGTSIICAISVHFSHREKKHAGRTWNRLSLRPHVFTQDGDATTMDSRWSCKADLGVESAPCSITYMLADTKAIASLDIGETPHTHG